MTSIKFKYVNGHIIDDKYSKLPGKISGGFVRHPEPIVYYNQYLCATCEAIILERNGIYTSDISCREQRLKNVLK